MRRRIPCFGGTALSLRIEEALARLLGCFLCVGMQTAYSAVALISLLPDGMEFLVPRRRHRFRSGYGIASGSRMRGSPR